MDEAGRYASRRAGTWMVLGIALVLAAAAVPAVAAVPAAWGVDGSPGLPPALSGACPQADGALPAPGGPGNAVAPEDGAASRGPVCETGPSWRPSLYAEPRRSVHDGVRTIAHLPGPGDSILPGAPLEGVLHGLAPPDL